MLMRQLEYVVALARERHFGRAAATCNVSQPALSTAIQKLERELGVPIIRRGQRFEGLTEEGARVVEWASRILADRDGLQDDLASIHGGLAGRLRVGAIPSALPVTALLNAPFCAAHPRATVEVVSLSSIEIERRLHGFEIDVGLTYLDNEPLPNVATTPVYLERYILLTPAAGPFAGRTAVGWREAAAAPLCLLTEDMQNRRIVDAIFHQAGATPVPTVETNSLSTLTGHVQTGAWSSVLPHAWLRSIGAPAGTRAIPLVEPAASHAVGLVLAEREPLPLLVRAYRDLVAGLAVQAVLDGG